MTTATKDAIESAAEKPVAVEVCAESVPAELRERPQWVCWRYKRVDGTWTKVPVAALGGIRSEGEHKNKLFTAGNSASSTDPATWARFDIALAYYQGHRRSIDGIGYVFAKDDPFCGVDLDDCRDREADVIKPWGQRFISLLDSYTEVSPSGTGVKVWCRAQKLSGWGCKKKYQDGEVEIYDKERFFAVTGAMLDGTLTTVEDRQQQVETVYAEAWKPSDEKPSAFNATANGSTHTEHASTDDVTDERVIEKLLADPKAKTLWEGSVSGHGGDESAADLALCNKLAFWGGPDRIDRLFRRSGLMRAKWDEKRGAKTYGALTIATALKDRTDFYQWHRNGTGADTANDTVKPSPASQLKWTEPVPLSAVPDVTPFPVDILPWTMQRLVNEMATALNTPTDFTAVPMLALAGGAIGNRAVAKITRSHNQSACLFAAVVARPGDGKSTPLKMLRRPFDAAQGNYLDRWREAMTAWEGRDDTDKGARPVLQRCVVGDTTMESLGVTLAENPYGVMMVRDELNALLQGMNQYKGGKGSDRQVLLSLWGGDTVVIDRKSDKSRQGAPLVVPRPFCGIVGTVQPDILEKLRGDKRDQLADDGLVDRFLFSFPVPKKAAGENWDEVSREAEAAWNRAVEHLLNKSMVEDRYGDEKDLQPQGVWLSTDARAEWQTFTTAHAAEINGDNFPHHLFGVWSKLKGYCGRLALIVHQLREACGEDVGTEIDGGSMARAIRLVDYFKSHARKVHIVMATDGKTGDARKLVHWLGKEKPATFAKRDAFNALRGTWSTVEEFDPVLELVEKHGYVRPVQDGDRPGPGRKPSPVYETHPCLLAHSADCAP